MFVMVGMGYGVGWGRHHHRIGYCMLQLRALVIVWMSRCWDGSRRHRWSSCTIWWRRISSRWWVLHVSLWRHLSHVWRSIHGIRRHARRIMHRLHIRRRNKSTRGSRRRHSRHHRLTRITIRWVIHIPTSSGLSGSIFVV